jgi:hypothetical protein
MLAIALLAIAPGCGVEPAASDRAPTEAPSARPTPMFDRDVKPLLATYCLGCHEGTTPSGGLALDRLAVEDGARADVATWERVIAAIHVGEMPPPDEPAPASEEVAALESWLDAEVFRCGGRDPGRVALRRLNRLEYNNTIRDLIGLDLRPADDFPADDVGDGFDNNGDVLSLPPVLAEKYLAAAEAIVEAAFRSDESRSRILNPPVDRFAFIHRAGNQPVRDQPRKRIGVPAQEAPRVEDPATLEAKRAVEILRGFADRAYRRPATHEELDRLRGLFEAARKDGDNFEAAIRYALSAVLVSPHFLFRVEKDAEGIGPHPVGDFELAVRLSYFLWSSMPDDELSAHALDGTLRHVDVLAAQVRRMLRDPRARALVDGFAVQWLQVRSLKDVTPDPEVYPDFDEPLRRSMQRETELFCESIIREDRGVFDFLDADYSFLDGRLARHYGIEGVAGDGFRRVSLSGTARGGVLTHASVLTVTSNPTRTSPVKRGKWVLDNLLGAPPSPPPPGVEGLVESDGHGSAASGTIRQRMERHRTAPACATCHSRMDPIGFGLEAFDGLGAWRDREEGRPVDSSGAMPGGKPFRGPAELRAILASHRDAFARCLAAKLLSYALGRGPSRSDRCVSDEAARSLVAGPSRFSDLVLAIVASPAFQSRTRTGAER